MSTFPPGQPPDTEAIRKKVHRMDDAELMQTLQTAQVMAELPRAHAAWQVLADLSAEEVRRRKKKDG